MCVKAKMPRVLWLSVAIFTLYWFPALAQMSSSSYRIPVSVMDATGTQKSSENYRMKDAVGQPTPIGSPEKSTDYKVFPGFIYSDGQIYIPGDANWSPANSTCAVDLGDAIYVLNYLFKGGPCPHPMAAGDVNCDCIVNLGDVVCLLNYLFKHGDEPKPGCVASDP